MAKPIVRFSEVSREKQKIDAKNVRASFFARGRAAMEQVGDDIAGFAIVVWDGKGDMRTAYDATRGLMGPALHCRSGFRRPQPSRGSEVG